MYCLNLLRIALELARHNQVYEDIATKFFEHFLDIAAAINGVEEGALGLWDEQDEFYYDRLCLPDGESVPLKVRSMVGLIPLFAVEVLEPALLEGTAGVRRPDGMVSQSPAGPGEAGFALARMRHRRTPLALAVARSSHEMPASPRAG